MKKILILVIAIVLCFFHKTYSQEIQLSALTIPKELRENANAVIRDFSMEVTIESVNKMKVKRKKVITFLNRIGHRQYFNAQIGYSPDIKVNKLSAKIYNAMGEEVKKFSKGKFIDVSAVSDGSLYDDTRIKYIEYTPTAYPYTLVFESEYTTSTTGFIPRWIPIRNYFLGVERSSYRIINQTSNKIRIKEKQFKDFNISKTSLENGFIYELKKAKPIKYEQKSIAFTEFTPELIVAINTFSLKGVMGSATDWKSFGLWRYNYLKNGKDEVSDEIKNRALKLVKGVEDPIEKAKIIYKYVQDKTRYISVQEGVGGWKPIAANRVDAVGYGDCKGLTNYTKALLDVVGVKSHYSVIWAGGLPKDVEEDFFSMQGNHVILNIPIEGKEDVWLECTSQIAPFGFLGDFTDDRNVLVITPEGGIIKRTPSYYDEKNLQKTNATISLLANGDIEAKVTRLKEGIQYDDIYPIESMSKDDLDKYFKTRVWDYNNNLEIQSIELKNDKEAVRFTDVSEVKIEGYASVNENEYIFRLNAFNMFNSVPKRYRNRKLPLKIYRGFKDVDTYEIKLPKDFSATLLPQNIDVSSKFGSYKMSLERKDEKTLIYKKELILKHGEYPKEEYKTYRKFMRKIARYENMKIALTKSKT